MEKNKFNTAKFLSYVLERVLHGSRAMSCCQPTSLDARDASPRGLFQNEASHDGPSNGSYGTRLQEPEWVLQQIKWNFPSGPSR
jgi:hypothetical protein